MSGTEMVSTTAGNVSLRIEPGDDRYNNSERHRVLAGYIGAGFNVRPIPQLTLYGRAYYGAGGVGSGAAYLGVYEGGAELELFDQLSAFAAWRGIGLHSWRNRFNATLQLRGPVVGLIVKF